MAKATPKPRFTRPTPKRGDWRDIYKEPDYKGPGRRLGKKNPLSAVQGRDWIQESYETGDPEIRRRVATLKKLGYRAKSFPMGNQVTQWGNVKLSMVDIRAGSSGDSYLERVPKPGAKNPARRGSLPIGKLVTVRARRLKNGRVELYR